MSLHDDVAFLSVEELSRRVKARTLSSVDLTNAYLARIEALAKPLNCYITVTADLAREDAKRADSEIAAGKWRGPLHGIPYGLKDLVDTKGIRTTFGAKPFEQRVPEADATVYRKLREAGAVLLGKTSMIELAGGLGYHWADAAFNGACRTPWDIARWAGGSSSGSGSAVAAGLAAFAIGSETWGSIVCPAAFNGVTGLRPTYGAVSRSGALALVWSFDKIGPICRAAGDTALVLGAIAGRDPADATTTDPPRGLDSVKTASGNGMKIAWLAPPKDSPHDHASVDPIHQAVVATFKAAGVTIEPLTLPKMPYDAAAVTILTCDVVSGFEGFLAKGLTSQLADKTHREGRTMYDYPHPTGADYVKAQRVRRAAQVAMDALLAKYDAVLAPNFLAPPPLCEKNIDDQLPGGDPMGAIGALCGLPAIAFPAGFTAAKLPISMQLVGKPFDEARLVSLAALFQSKTRFHTERPPNA